MGRQAANAGVAAPASGVRRAAGSVALSVATSNEDPLVGNLVGLGLAVPGGPSWYFPFGHQGPLEASLDDQSPLNLPFPADPALRLLRDFLADESVARHVGSKPVRKVIVVPGKLVNVVV